MRIRFSRNRVGPTFRAGRVAAFTLTEVMIASALMVMIAGGVLIGNSFGIQMLGIVQPKLLAHEEAKSLIRQLTEDVSQAKFVRVGTGDSGSFTQAPDGSAKQGNALEVYSTNDTTVGFIRYFHDTGDNTLKRMTDLIAAETVATAVGNTQVFTAEDFTGQPLTYEQPRLTVGVVLDYFELPGSQAPVGTNEYFTSYTLKIKLAAGNR